MNTLKIDGNSLNLNQIKDFIENKYSSVALTNESIKNIQKGNSILKNKLNSNKIIYGVNTGFGKLAQVKIPENKIKLLQYNLLRSHASGVGKPLSIDLVRTMMLLKINALAKGSSGVRLELVSLLIGLLNNEIYPVIPEKGSVGASGDLAPLAHLALPLIGEGEVFLNGKIVNANEALNKKKLTPSVLEAKEGLALINGTQAMTAHGAIGCIKANNLLNSANIICAMTIEALLATDAHLNHEIHALRGLPGQIEIARELREILKGSEIISSHKNCEKVQDAYSLRCVPQVHGAILDQINHASKIIETELNAATDNPLILLDQDEIISGGNFHGEPIAFALDNLAIVISELGNISERRIERLVNPSLSNLPPFLTKMSGLNSGFMIPQVVASSLVSENKVLAHPASVDSIPTSANQEDHVSMGYHSSKKALDIVENVTYILAIELLCACQGLDFRLPLKPAKKTEQVYNFVRAEIPSLEEDRILSHDIEKIADFIRYEKLPIK
jgi:histidine ammonia-lyase